MLRIQVQNVAAAARRYFVDGLASDDYYRAGTELPGHWFGVAAERIGISGPVEYSDFAALTENLHPQTGKPLTPRKNDDRRIGYDTNFHAPKSVSVAYFLTGDERIREAFTEAVRETMQEIETHMATRVRRGGANHDRVTASMVWAEYLHFTTRPVDGIPDPHLHAHNFAFNCTWDPEEARWKAGQFVEMVRHAPYFQDVFHARLARNLGDLGLHITPTEFAFELGWVPDGLIERFSRRKRFIETIAEKMGITDAAQKAGLGAKTRERKRDDISLEELKEIWLARLTDEDRQWLDLIYESLQKGIPFHESPQVEPSLNDAPDMHDMHAGEATRPAEPGRATENATPNPERDAGRPASSEQDQPKAGQGPESNQQREYEQGPTQAGPASDRSKRHGKAEQAQAGPSADGERKTQSQDSKQRSADGAKRAGSGPGDNRMGASPKQEEKAFRARESRHEPRPSLSAKRAIDFALQHLMEKESVVTEQNIVRHAMRHSRGRATPDEVWAALKERDDIMRKTIAGKRCVTTKEAIREEKRMIDFAKDGRDQMSPLGAMPLSRSAFKLSATDWEVLRGLMDSRDRVTLLKMTGASFRPEILRAAWQGVNQGGSRLMVFGATAAASRDLEKRYGLLNGAPTVDQLLSNPKTTKRLQGMLVDKVIWVEQAGRLGTKAMHALFELARKNNCRVVLSGDEDGLRASARGDAFRIIRKHAGLNTVEWHVNEHKEGAFFEDTFSIRDRQRNVGKQFAENGRYRQTPVGSFVHEEAAKRFIEVSQRKKTAILVGPTKDAVKWLNRSARTCLRAAGKLKGPDYSFLQLNPVSMSRAEKQDPKNYRRGQYIEFHQSTPGFRSGDRARVVGVLPLLNQVIVSKPLHTPVKLFLSHADRFAVYEAERSHIAIGDKIRMTRNVKPVFGRPVRNQSLQTVVGIVPATRDLILKSGRILSRRCGHFVHDYATTPHGLQGRSADSVIMAVDGFDWKRVGNEQLTTATESAVNRFEIFSDSDPKELDKAVLRTANRMSATDFDERAEHFNDQAEHKQQAEQDQKDMNEEHARQARREDSKASGQFNRFWQEVRDTEQTRQEEEQELARKNQEEREQQLRQSGNHSHGI
ncbi:MAG: relaxase domain-containing protein [Planctomycetota bacterium]|nr:MAG: relaxase domain-containing protein [Planctomycetota bacterium]